MGIGQRVQVQLVKLVTVKGADGNWTTPTEGDKFGVWAEVSNTSGFREYAQGQTQLGKTKTFLIRFRFDKYPGADWKIRYQEADWTISERDNVDEKRFYWRIRATKRDDV